MNREYLHGYALAKKSKGKVQILETPYGLGDFVPVLAEGTTKPRMLKDRFADVVNVKDFGAVGDGVHDDTQAIQAALNNASGKTVFFDGQFKLITQGVRFRSNQKIIFSPGSKLIRGFKVGADGSSVLARVEAFVPETGVQDIFFEGAVFDGNCTESDFGSIMFDVFLLGTKGKSAKNVHFSKCTFMDWTNAHAIDMHSSSFVTIDDCRFVGMKYDPSLDDDTLSSRREAVQIEPDCSDVSITRCYFGPGGKATDAPRCGIGNHGWAENDPANQRISVELCTFDRCAFAGIHVYVWENSCIKNNVFFCEDLGIALNSRHDAASKTSNVNKNILIEGNYFEGSSNARLIYSYSYGDKGLDISAADTFFSQNYKIRGNTFKGGKHSIASNDVLGAEIICNTFIRPENTCIYGIAGGEFFVDSNVFDSCVGPCLYAQANVSSAPAWRNSAEVNSGWTFTNNSIYNPSARIVHVTATPERIRIHGNRSFEKNDRSDNLTYYQIQYGSANKVRAIITDNICETKSAGRLMVTGRNEEVVTKGNIYLVNNQLTDPYNQGTSLGSFDHSYLNLAPHASSTINKVSCINFLKGHEKECGIHAYLNESGTSVLFLGKDRTGKCADLVALSAKAGEDILYDGKTFYAEQDATVNLGGANIRWSNVYASTGSINTSDERAKQNIIEPDEVLMRAWGKVNFRVFQFKDAIERKGVDARLHVGVIAQQVIEAFKSEGLDATRYGLLCHDKWQDEYEDIEIIDQVEVVDEDGKIITPQKTHIETKLVTKAGDRYGIRYEEALALEAAYQRWRLSKIESALAEKGIKL